MNKLPDELRQMEIQLSRLVPDSDSGRDNEVLRALAVSQPTIASNVTPDLSRAKRQSFLLGGILGLCVGAIAVFLMFTVFMEPAVQPVATPIPPVDSMKFVANIEALQTATSTDAIRHLVPPPSAFWVPFSVAALLVVFVTLLTRHLRVRFVF